MTEMQITSAQYVADPITGINNCINAIIDGVQLSVPLDPTNRHYADIMRQVAAGTLTIQDVE